MAKLKEMKETRNVKVGKNPKQYDFYFKFINN